MKKKEQRVIYYKDELNDEFAGDSIKPKVIDSEYKYIRDGLCGKSGHFFWYRVIAIPLAFLYLKIHFHHKIVNKHVLKGMKKTGYFMYGNHTHFLADALIPTMVSVPKDTYVIVHPNNVSMPFLGRITPSLGALPLPDGAAAAKNFIRAIEYRISGNNCIMIYPEAHIWPFYTDIRPFKDVSFRYPVQYKKPVFCLTNTYRKRRFSNIPQIVTYIDGPFHAEETDENGAAFTAGMKKKRLRDKVYETMKARSKYSNVQIIRYEKEQMI